MEDEGRPDLTYQDVLAILRLVDAGPFSTFEVAFGGTSLKVTRDAGAQKTSTPDASDAGRPPAGGAPNPKASSSPPEAEREAPEERAAAAAFAGAVEIRPPMSGTFYAAPSPGAPSYVAVGAEVRRGEQVGTVEVMKLFTAITAPCDGIVRAILVENEQVVDKDEPIMLVEATDDAS